MTTRRRRPRRPAKAKSGEDVTPAGQAGEAKAEAKAHPKTQQAPTGNGPSRPPSTSPA